MTIKEILSEADVRVRLNEYILLSIFVALHGDKNWVTVRHIQAFIKEALPWAASDNAVRNLLRRAVASGLLDARVIHDRSAPNAGTRGSPAHEYRMADLGRERFKRIELDRASILALSPPIIRLAKASGIGPRDRGVETLYPVPARSASYGG
jgi:hypothetical protein